jgi:hypothetical protein
MKEIEIRKNSSVDTESSGSGSPMAAHFGLIGGLDFDERRGLFPSESCDRSEFLRIRRVRRRNRILRRRWHLICTVILPS